MSVRRLDLAWANSAQKADIVVEIAARLGLAAPPMSSGSTEPKLIFTMVNERLGLGLSARLAKPEMARAIVEAAGDHWHPDFESRGATVTKNGLLAVLDAVAFFLA